MDDRMFPGLATAHTATHSGRGAFVPPALCTRDAPDRHVDIDIAGSRVSGVVSFAPAFDRSGARMRARP